MATIDVKVSEKHGKRALALGYNVTMLEVEEENTAIYFTSKESTVSRHVLESLLPVNAKILSITEQVVTKLVTILPLWNEGRFISSEGDLAHKLEVEVREYKMRISNPTLSAYVSLSEEELYKFCRDFNIELEGR